MLDSLINLWDNTSFYLEQKVFLCPGCSAFLFLAIFMYRLVQTVAMLLLFVC